MKTASLSSIFFFFLWYLPVGVVEAQVYKNITEGSDRLTIRAKAGNSDIEGSAYLYDNWLPGRVQFTDGSQPQQGQLKYDALEQVLVTKGEGDVENTFTAPIKSFDLQVNNKWYRYVRGFESKYLKPNSFVKIIHQSDKIGFYQLESKTILESKEYNTPTVHRKFESSVYYYLQLKPTDRDLVLVKKDTKSILGALKRADLAAYVKDKKLNLKVDEDLQAFFIYYDSL